MLGRNVERGEIVEIVLDMRPFRDGEAHLAEDRDQLIDSLADRMNAAIDIGFHRPNSNRKGDVDTLFLEPLIERRTIVLLLRRTECFFDRAFKLI